MYSSLCVDSHANKFEGFLGKKSYFAGETVTAGDFHVFEMVDQHEMMAARASLPSPLAKYPNLKAFYARFKALPQLEAYFASDACKLIVNNKVQT